MEFGRGDEQKIAGLCLVIFKVYMIGTGPFRDQCQLCFLMPVSRDSRVEVREFCDVSFQRKHLFTVLCVLFLCR